MILVINWPYQGLKSWPPSCMTSDIYYKLDTWHDTKIYHILSSYLNEIKLVYVLERKVMYFSWNSWGVGQ